MDQKSTQDEILQTPCNSRHSESARGHRRHSVTVFEGTSNPSLSTLLNETDEFIAETCDGITGVHLSTSHPNQNRNNSPGVSERRPFHRSKTTPTPSNLMEDISRCQDQVEELIQLFSIMSTNQHQPSPPEQSSKTPRRVSSSRRGDQRSPPQGQDLIDEGPLGPVLDLENARTRLEQSLEDALRVLDQLPQRTKPSEYLGEDLSSKRRVYYDSEEELPDAGPSRPYRCDPIYDLRQISQMERWPIIEESIQLISPSTSVLQNDPNSNSRPPFGSSRTRTDVGVQQEPLDQRTGPVISTFRVLFPDPIPHGRLPRSSSQNLSGIESTLPTRIRPRIERDAWSDSEDLLTDKEPTSPLRRTKSASSVLLTCTFTSLLNNSRESKLHLKTCTSAGASSDWDVVEGGIAIRERRNPVTLHNRLAPVEALWTGNSLPCRHPSKLRTLRRDPTGISLLSEFSDAVFRPERAFYKIDQSVQCDLCTGRSEQELTAIEASGCVPSLFKKKKQNGKKEPLTQTMISNSFLPQAM